MILIVSIIYLNSFILDVYITVKLYLYFHAFQGEYIFQIPPEKNICNKDGSLLMKNLNSLSETISIQINSAIYTGHAFKLNV